jgi:outer membrane lipoprotein LolB
VSRRSRHTLLRPAQAPGGILKWLLLTVVLLLSACATPAPDGDGAWINGRLALKVAATGERPAQSVNAGFALRGNGDSGALRLLSPLGTQLAEARWAPGRATLVSAQGESRFDDLDALSREVLGEPLPLAALPDWLAGRPWRGAASTPTTSGFVQLGWQVELARFGDGYLEASRAAAPAVQLRVRLEPAP